MENLQMRRRLVRGSEKESEIGNVSNWGKYDNVKMEYNLNKILWWMQKGNYTIIDWCYKSDKRAFALNDMKVSE